MGQVDAMRSKIVDYQSNIKNQAVKLEKNLATFETQKAEKVGQIDEYFEKLLAKVVEARETLKSEFNELCESKNSQMSVCLNEYKKYLCRLEATKTKLEKLSQEISMLKSPKKPLSSSIPKPKRQQ